MSMMVPARSSPERFVFWACLCEVWGKAKRAQFRVEGSRLVELDAFNRNLPSVGDSSWRPVLVLSTSILPTTSRSISLHPRSTSLPRFDVSAQR